MQVLIRSCPAAPDAAFEAEVRAGLTRAGAVVTSQEVASISGSVLLLPPGDPPDGEAAKPVGEYSLAVIRSRLGLTARRAWRLLQMGFADVLVWEEQPEPAASLLARLARFEEVKAVLDSPLVRDNLVGRSPVWRRALGQVIGTARAPEGALLVTGETGTGKELVARLFHTLDPRPEKRQLVTLDCTTVVQELSGSEFFGHERGAFTSAVGARDGAFALADQGTLFLDEVGELPLSMQAELLRVVQEHTYKRVGGNEWKQADFRLVCATHRDLHAEEGRGNFRRDFYHRIAASTVHLPPLRERREDIVPLTRHFLASPSVGLAGIDLDPAVAEFLATRDYPGNVRELRQLVLRIARRHVGRGPITIGDVPEADRRAAAELAEGDWRQGDLETAIRRALGSGTRLPELKEQVADVAIEIAIRDAEGNLQRAALRLGVTDRALQLRRAGQRNGSPGRGEARLKAARIQDAATDRSPPELRPGPSD